MWPRFRARGVGQKVGVRDCVIMIQIKASDHRTPKHNRLLAWLLRDWASSMITFSVSREGILPTQAIGFGG
jgi:hypothetical protein